MHTLLSAVTPTSAASRLVPASTLGARWGPHLSARDDILMIACRHWTAATKRIDLLALKRAKTAPDKTPMVNEAATELAALAIRILGDASGWSVASISCGHSQRADCFGCRVAQLVAQRLDRPFRKLWADRFLSGSSHPMQWERVPPLAWLDEPLGPTIIVDDVATSGRHVAQAVQALRARGAAALGLVWIEGERA